LVTFVTLSFLYLQVQIPTAQKPNVEAFYADHLEWFYESTFNVEEARIKVEDILSAVESNRRTALLKKRKLLQD
jgi:hypothetical protein